jgi:RNA recognition motif-containing protein
MASTTLVATGGKGSNPKTTLYVGGLAENVNEEILQAAFLPFGNLKDINIPLDHATGKHRGARLLCCCCGPSVVASVCLPSQPASSSPCTPGTQ